MKYYIYQLIDPRNSKIFYIGKGQKLRMYQHVKDVQRGRIPNGSNNKLGNKIKKILLIQKIKYKKVFETNNEQEAYDKEKELIIEIGLENLCNISLGQDHTPFIRGKTWEEIYGIEQASKMRTKTSERMKGNTLLSDYVAKNGAWNKGKTGYSMPKKSEELKEKIRQAILNSDKFKKSIHNPDRIKVITEKAKKITIEHWKNPEYVKKVMNGRKIFWKNNPTIKKEDLIKILQYNLSVHEMIKELGVSIPTFYKYKKLYQIN